MGFILLFRYIFGLHSVVSVYIWASFYCFGIYLGFILLFRYIFGLHSVVSVYIWASFCCFGIYLGFILLFRYIFGLHSIVSVYIWASFYCFGIYLGFILLFRYIFGLQMYCLNVCFDLCLPTIKVRAKKTLEDKGQRTCITDLFFMVNPIIGVRSYT